MKSSGQRQNKGILRTGRSQDLRGPDTKALEELTRDRREALDKWTESRRDRRQDQSRNTGDSPRYSD